MIVVGCGNVEQPMELSGAWCLRQTGRVAQARSFSFQPQETERVPQPFVTKVFFFGTNGWEILLVVFIGFFSISQ
jgi:hypothetical protein